MARLARLGGLAFERSRPAERALSAVLFTDIVDSTSTAMRMGDAAWRKVLAAHDVMVRSHLARYQGAEVKHTGDGFLATFESPAHAVNCAIDLTAAVQDLGVEIRSGVHVGEVEWREGDVAGACVHIGARIASVAGPSEVLVSRPVTEVVAGSALRFEAGGQRTFKGVAEPWHVFTVEREATTST